MCVGGRPGECHLSREAGAPAATTQTCISHMTLVRPVHSRRVHRVIPIYIYTYRYAHTLTVIIFYLLLLPLHAHAGPFARI